MGFQKKNGGGKERQKGFYDMEDAELHYRE